MTLESLQEDHRITQRKISNTARSRHFESKGRFENELTLVQTIQSLEDRILKLELTLKELTDGIESSGSSDDTRSHEHHGDGSGEVEVSRVESPRADFSANLVINNDFVR